MIYDVVVIGSGPSGLMAAIKASEKNTVLLIEKNSTPGKKLLITGGSRCNVTNLKDNNLFLDNINYNKKFLYSAINKFGPTEIYNFFNGRNVFLKEEVDNQIFPVSNKASSILNALLSSTNKVDFKYEEEVLDIKVNKIIEIITNKSKYQTKNVIIATGGSSYKETGSTGDNLKFAKKLNQPTTDLFPVETGLVVDEQNNLAGTAFEKVDVTYLKYHSTGKLIFTHKGLSGSAIMKISEHIYQNDCKEIIIDFIPDKTVDELNQLISNDFWDKTINNFFNSLFTKKFSFYLIDKLGLPSDIKIKQLNNKQLSSIIEIIKTYKVKIKEVENLERAFVTGGGIDMRYIDSTTMESKINNGVYFVGEALDIHGPIGGYNITLALSTGYLAGMNIKK